MASGPKAVAEGDNLRPQESSLDPDPTRTIRQQFADELRARLASGQAGNPLWEAAGMAKLCRAALEKISLGSELLDMTFGDIDSRRFDGDEGRRVAEGLGQIADGPKRALIEFFEHQLLVEQMNPTTESPWGYDRSGIGNLRLRAQFSKWINGFGLPFTTEQTMLAPGSFAGLDNVIGRLAFEARQRGLQTDFIATGPGFWNIAICADARGVPVVKIDVHEQNGYSPSPQAISESLGERSLNVSTLYVTPWANPTSTVYDHRTFCESLDTFVSLRPNGVILLDLAYIEMVPQEQAEELFRQISPDIRKRIIFSCSMSKLFGYPRLRMAALQTDNDRLFTELPGVGSEIPEKQNIRLFDALQNQWKVAIVTLSEPTEREALALWEYVSRNDRERLYALFRARQTAVLQRIMKVNDERIRHSLPPVVDMSHVHRNIPLYLYVTLTKNVDFLNFFVETGILGAPGEMFGDRRENNMLRMSMGIESMEEIPG